jgi:hypothetical protein
MPVTPRTPAVAALAVVLAFAAACAGSSGKGATGAPASTSPSPAAPLDAAAAHRIAVATQLTAADLPGYKEDASAAGDADQPDATDKELQACISGKADPGYLADVTSSDFTKGAGPGSELTVGSETQVVPTAEQGKQEFASLQKPETLACLNTAFNKIFSADAEGGAFKGSLQRASVSTPAGADGAAAFTIAGAYTLQGVTANVQAGLELILVGRAEITLHHFSVGGVSLTSADGARLRDALVKRGKEAQA